MRLDCGLLSRITVFGFHFRVEGNRAIWQHDPPSTFPAIDHHDDLSRPSGNERRMAKPDKIWSNVRERINAIGNFERELHAR
jgi:hypothetical protein